MGAGNSINAGGASVFIGADSSEFDEKLAKAEAKIASFAARVAAINQRAANVNSSPVQDAVTDARGNAAAAESLAQTASQNLNRARADLAAAKDAANKAKSDLVTSDLEATRALAKAKNDVAAAERGLAEAVKAQGVVATKAKSTDAIKSAKALEVSKRKLISAEKKLTEERERSNASLRSGAPIGEAIEQAKKLAAAEEEVAKQLRHVEQAQRSSDRASANDSDLTKKTLLAAEAKKQLAAATKDVAAARKRLEAVKGLAEDSAEKTKKVAKATEDLAKAEAKSETASKKSAVALITLANAESIAEREAKKLADRAKAIDAAMDGTAAAVDKASSKIKRFGQTAREGASAAASIGGSLKSIGRNLLAFGAATAAGIGIASKKFAELEDALLATKGITVATESQYVELTNTVRQLGATTSFTAKQAADASTELARGGQSIDEINAGLSDALDLARGTGTELGFTAATVVRALGQFGLGVDDSGRAVDTLAFAANAGTLRLEDLAESMKFLGPIASTAGETMETMGAAMAVMANNGLRGGIAGRQLRRVFFELAETAKQVKIKELFDINVADASGKLKPLAVNIRAIGAELDKLGSAEKIGLLDEIFGEGAAAFESLSKGIDELEKLNDEILLTDGYASDLADTIDSGMGGAFRLAVSAVNDMAIALGSALGPEIVGLLQGIRELAGGLSKLFEGSSSLGPSILKLTVAFGAAGTALVAVGTILTAVVVPTLLLAAFAATTAGAAMLPFLLLIAGTVGISLFVATMIAGTEALDLLASAAKNAKDKVGLAVPTKEYDKLFKIIGDLLDQEDPLSREQGETALSAVQRLEKMYGGLGVTVDAVTGKISGLDRALKVAEARKAVEVNQSKLKDKTTELNEATSKLLRGETGAGSSKRDLTSTETRRLKSKITKAKEAQDVLRKILRQSVEELEKVGGTGLQESRVINQEKADQLAEQALAKKAADEQRAQETLASLSKGTTDKITNDAKLALAGVASLGDDSTARVSDIARQALKDVKEAAKDAKDATPEGSKVADKLIDERAALAREAIQDARREASRRISLAKKEESALKSRVSQIANIINSEKLKARSGEFGGLDLADRVSKQTIDIGERQLSEQEKSTALLTAIRSVLEAGGGIPVGAN